MSVDITQYFSAPLKKRPHETISLASDGSSKCAEIFVTNNADKWTFFCAYCQMATCDIGAFICHIRLEHLNVPADSTQSQPAKDTLLLNDQNLTRPITTIHIQDAKDVQQPLQSNVIKEEVVEANNQIICAKVANVKPLNLPESIETDNQLANKNDIENRPNEIQDEFYEINEFETLHESITNEYFQEVNELNAISCYSLSDDDDTHFESDNNRASGSMPNKRRKKNTTDIANNELLHYKCPTCNRGFKTKQGAIQHILYNHDENYHTNLPIKCRVCHRGFHTASGLKAHIKSHDENKHLQCAVCNSKHTESYFITHVLMHESDSCFPCQVCGKIYDSHDERMQHWETHAQEKPFYCKICYRRYRKQQYLTHHLKSHNQYQCNFCSTEFTAAEPQKAPYVCPQCEKLTEIKQKAEHLRSLAYKNHVFDSDEESPAIYNPVDNDSLEHDDELSNEDCSDLEFVDETYDVDTNDHNHMPSGSSHNNTTHSHGDSPHKCSYCDRIFTSRQALAPHLKCHINNDHAGFPFKCSYCNRGFQTKSGLNAHHKTHDKNTYQSKCPICPFTSYREGDFIKHVLTHENETCFPCQVCAKILPSNEERLTHWKIHVHEKPHGCKFCYRRFTLKHILRRHIKTHKEYTE